MRANKTPRAVAACALIATPLVAHEFWLEPRSFTPRVAEPVAIELRVGDAMPGQTVPRNESRTLRFESIGGEAASPVLGRDGSTPAGLVRLREAGLHTIAFESTHARIEIDDQRFGAYLEDKGLAQVAEERRARGENSMPGRERFARCAKALVTAGSRAAGHDRFVGMTLELVAEDNPYALAADEPLSLRLLFRGQPLSNALIKAWLRGGDGSPISARTDDSGRVSMTLSGSGMWLVSAVHMLRSDQWPDAEWESYWASLTFERAGQRR